jgi:hypothetical protein
MDTMKRIASLVLVLVLSSLAFAQAPEDSIRRKIIETANKYRGIPYIYGAESASAFDCSGFVRWVYREATGLELPRSSRAYIGVGQRILPTAAKAGDIFVFDTVGGAPSHVAIYAGDNKFIHAVSAGPRTGVIESPITDRYWAPKVIDVRTVLGSTPITRPPAAVPSAPSPAPGPTTATPPATPRPAVASGSGPGTLVAVVGDAPTADIGLVIPSRKQSSEDPIPAAPGTGIAFTLTNGTGKSGTFIVVFFRTDPRTFRLHEIHQEKITLTDGKAHSLPAFRFDESGKYRLIVRDNWGTQLLERTFTVN